METNTTCTADTKRTALAKLLHPTIEERKRMLRIEAWILVIFAYALIVFSFAWPPDYRNSSTVYVAISWSTFMVRTFAFHLGLLIAVIAIITLWRKYWRLFFACIPLLAVTVGPALIKYLPKNPPAATDDAITVMSVNLLMINQNTEPLLDEILSVSPDILLLQEYTDHWHQAVQLKIGRQYPHHSFETREDSFGTAIYSRFPFSKPVNMNLPLGQATEPQIRALIQAGDKTVAVYNIHVLPPWGLEYTVETRRQFADLLDLLSDESHPTILAGDFNFTETSPNAHDLTGLGLTDTLDTAGTGRCATWPVNSFFRWIPSIRLDHIYCSEDLVCHNSFAGHGAGSDHRPVIARLSFAD